MITVTLASLTDGSCLSCGEKKNVLKIEIGTIEVRACMTCAVDLESQLARIIANELQKQKDDALIRHIRSAILEGVPVDAPYEQMERLGELGWIKDLTGTKRHYNFHPTDKLNAFIQEVVAK